jgi:hypothetical protein
MTAAKRHVSNAFLCLLGLLLLYSLWTVAAARRRTPGILAGLRSRGALELSLRDFGTGRLDTLLAVEDPGFYGHHGIDLTTPGAGITTITQGLAKLLYFDRFRPGPAKYRQSLIAVWALDALVPKDEQLLLFINLVPLGSVDGHPVSGFAGAARAYFGKEYSALTSNEYLSLVAMIIAPATFHVKAQAERNADRVAALQRLLSGSYRPLGLMDLYYGGRTFRNDRGRLRRFLNHWVWGH